MSPRSIILSALAAGSLVATPIAMSVTTTAHAESQNYGQTICVEKSNGHCNSHKGKNGEPKSSDENDRGQLRITKTWLDGNKKVDSAPFDPTYVVTCAEDEFTGTRDYLEAQNYPAGVCTVTEVGVPNNGWLEDASTQKVVFPESNDDTNDKLTTNESNENNENNENDEENTVPTTKKTTKNTKKTTKKTTQEGTETDDEDENESPAPASVSFVNKRLGFAAVGGAEATTTRRWTWTLDKAVDRSTVAVNPGATETVNYTVTPKATSTSTTALHGVVTVSNVPDWAVKRLTVTVNGLDLDCDVAMPVDDEQGDELDDEQDTEQTKKVKQVKQKGDDEDHADTLTLACAFDITNAPKDVEATVTFTMSNDSETVTVPLTIAAGTIIDIDRFATLTDAYDGAAPIVLNQAVDATNPRVESYSKSYTNTPGTIDDGDQKLIPGEVEIDSNVASLTVNAVKTETTTTTSTTTVKHNTETDDEEHDEQLVVGRGFAVVLSRPVPAPIVATATVTAIGNVAATSAQPVAQTVITPTVLPATTIPAPTTTPTPTTPSTTAAPAIVLAGDLLKTQDIPTSTVPTSVLGQSITSTPAFTGSSSTTLALLGAAAIALGGMFTALAAARRSKQG